MLELTLHPQKTKIIDLWNGKQGFDFLGFHNRKIKQRTRNGRMLTHYPSANAMKKMREGIKYTLSIYTSNDSIENRVKVLNRKLQGYRNYYSMKYSNKWLYKIDWYVIITFTIWDNYKRGHRKKFKGIHRIRNIINSHRIVKMVV